MEQLPIRRVCVPERSGMWIACFDVGMKVVLNVKVSCTVGVGANQNPAENQRQGDFLITVITERKKDKKGSTCSHIFSGQKALNNIFSIIIS